MSETIHRDAAEPERDEVETEASARRSVTITEAIVPAAGVAFAIYYLWTIQGMPFEARMSGVLISAAIFGLTALLTVRWIKDAVRQGVEPGGWSLLGQEGNAWIKRLAVLALIVAYVMILPQLGYFLSTFGFLAAAMAVLGVRSPLPLVLVPLITTCIGHFGFIIVLGISLPVGFIGELLSPLQRAVGI